MSKPRFSSVFAYACVLWWHGPISAQAAPDSCQRPTPRSQVAEPEDLRSNHGVLKVELTAYDSKQKDGSVRYCFVDANGQESPTLRAHPGDLVILTLTSPSTGKLPRRSTPNQRFRGFLFPSSEGWAPNSGAPAIFTRQRRRHRHRLRAYLRLL